MATSSSGSPNDGRGVDLAIFTGICLGDDTSRLSNACPKGISNFVRCIRSLGLLGRPSTRGRLGKEVFEARRKLS